MHKFLVILKVISKCLPYIIAALSGSAVGVVCAGCKCGSLISIVP